jgi:hypothetical protein
VVNNFCVSREIELEEKLSDDEQTKPDKSSDSSHQQRKPKSASEKSFKPAEQSVSSKDEEDDGINATAPSKSLASRGMTQTTTNSNALDFSSRYKKTVTFRAGLTDERATHVEYRGALITRDQVSRLI